MSGAPIVHAVVEGYAWPQSVVAGEAVGIHCSASVRDVTIEIARVGATREVVFRRDGIAIDHHAVPDDVAAAGCGWPAALTTLLCAVEPQVKTLLGIPDGVATAALIPMGYPAKAFPKKLARRPLEDTCFGDAWDAPVFA